MKANSSGSCSNIDSPSAVAVISFGRNQPVADRVITELSREYADVAYLEYEDGVFERAFEEYDAILGIMAVGIVVRKIAPLLRSKWEDAAVVAVDEGLNWAIPLVGGHHGANTLVRDLGGLGALPTVTTASEVSGTQSVESRAQALDADIETPASTVSTNLAVLDDELGPVARLDGPEVVLVSDDVTVLKRTEPDGIVLGTGCVSGVGAAVFLRAWERAVEAAGREFEEVEFVGTGRLKKHEDGLFEAARARGLGVVLFERETLVEFEGPSDSRASDLVGWPGIAESSAIAGGRNHELVLEKQTYEDAVTVAVGR